MLYLARFSSRGRGPGEPRDLREGLRVSAAHALRTQARDPAAGPAPPSERLGAAAPPPLAPGLLLAWG